MPLSNRLRTTLLLALVSGLPGFTAPTAETRKQVRAVRTAMPLVLDGRLEEVIWAQAPAASGFAVLSPDLGAVPRNDTQVRIVYDDHFVCIGARMTHPKGAATLVRQLHRRDQDSASDWFGVYIDSLHDRRSAFAFMVNAAGVQQDRVVYQEFNEDTSWDGVWESAVSCDADGWTAEIRIPLSLLRLKPTGDGQVWGINFLRADYLPKKEVSLWQVVPRGVNAWVSAFPDLVGIEGVKPQARREWIPYLSIQRKFETAQGFDDRKATHRAGLDAHLGINAYSQLDLTLRPDFGQVEVDQAVLNLGTYETFFPEKRPFFLEGMELFQFTGPQLFYSRRIGRGAGDPTLAEGETLVDRPAAAEILGAAKWTSKRPSGLNVGALVARVDAARATVRDAEGRDTQRELSPLTQVAVLRATQSLDARGSFVGGFGSFLSQAGVDGRQALVGGADLVLKSTDQGRRLEFSAVGTSAGPHRDPATGHYARFQLDQQWKNGWSLNAASVRASRDFNPNDLGFTPRPDRQMFELDLHRSWDQPSGPWRNRSWHGVYLLERDLAGQPFNHFVGTSVRTEFTSGWAVLLGAERNFSTRDDRELRTFRDPVKKYFRVEAYPNVFANLDAPSHWPWSLGLRWNRQAREGGPTQWASVWQSIRPLPQMEIQAETSLTRETGEPHYVETQGSTPIVGLRHMTSLNQTLTVSYAFSPRLTLQVFSQWMSASWAFRELKTWNGPEAFQAGARSDQATASDRLWNLHLITRWEFRPGSTLYAVYTHGACNGDPSPEPGHIRPRADLAALRSAPSDDVVQLKLSWLFR